MIQLENRIILQKGSDLIFLCRRQALALRTILIDYDDVVDNIKQFKLEYRNSQAIFINVDIDLMSHLECEGF